MDADPRVTARPDHSLAQGQTPAGPRVPAASPAGSPPVTPPVIPAMIPAMRHPGERQPCLLRPMTEADLPFVVAEHLDHFPHGFFARLGAGFLTSYTRTYLTGGHARAYVVEAAGHPVGFLVGVLDPPAHRRHVLRSHGLRLAPRALASLAVRPRLAWHFLRTRLGRYLRRLLPGRRTAGPVASPGATAVLSHVVVVSSARSLGVGAALIERFVADATDAGCARASLVTAAGADGAGPYYERRGWLARGETRTPDGRLLATYDLPLGSRHPEDPDR